MSVSPLLGIPLLCRNLNCCVQRTRAIDPRNPSFYGLRPVGSVPGDGEDVLAGGEGFGGNRTRASTASRANPEKSLWFMQASRSTVSWSRLPVCFFPAAKRPLPSRHRTWRSQRRVHARPCGSARQPPAHPRHRLRHGRYRRYRWTTPGQSWRRTL
jgi:hypothetical protein